MSSKLEDHAARSRCYRCGSSEIASLCHHCGKAMCGAHSPAVLDAACKPVSSEFSGLGLDGSQTGAHHCLDHAHIVKGGLIAVIVAGVAVAVLGVAVAFASVVPGLIILLAGAGTAAVGYWAHQRRMEAILAARPPLPVLPSLDSVSVLEKLHGQVRLGEDGTYESPPPEPAEGQVEVVMTLAKSGRDRLASYQSKYHLAAGDRIDFAAGFGVIRGEAGLTFTPGTQDAAVPLPGGTSLSFHGDMTGHPLFNTVNGRSSGQWTVRTPYLVHGDRAPENIPLWLVPSLLPASDQRTLELDLHWIPLREKQSPLELDRFELIELIVPNSWGNVESAWPPSATITSSDSAPTRTIQWKPLAPERDGQERDKNDQSRTLTVRFEKQIEKDDDKLRGKIQASFMGTISGVEGIDIYQPLGGKWRKPPASAVKTEVSVDFELSLRSVRYQDVRVVPDGNKDQGRDEVDEFPTVIPDFRTVIALTNEMSESGYYIKRVIENPPRGGGRADLLNRYWDMAGRRYDGVFPIDFHITLTGEEQHGGSIRASKGNTAARISVQGSYVNPAMERQIEHEWDRLHAIVGAKLEKREREAQQSAEPEYSQPYYSHPPTAAPSSDDDRVTRAATLRKRLDSATEALLEGRISEETYRDVRASIEQELGKI